MTNLTMFNMFTCSAINKELNLDLDSLKEFCEDVYKGSDCNVNRSLVNGWQSPNIKDKCPVDLLSAIETTAEEYRNILKIKPKLSVSNLWINRSVENSYNKEHVHPGCMISGVYYVSVPPESGKIKFINPCSYIYYDWNEQLFEEWNEYNSHIWWLPVVENNLYLFPSWLKHEVTLGKSKEPRISISFNLVVNN